MEKTQILELLKKNGLCILSTSSKDGKPESAVMAPTVKDDFTFLFNTDTNTRKYKNLQENNKVSIVVGGLSNDPTIQIDGIAKELNEKEGNNAKDYILNLHPDWKDYFNSETGRFFEVRPTWLRCSDSSKNPPETEEITNI